MTEETLETIILGHIAKELKDEIQIGRQVNLAKTIMQALRIHDVVRQSELLTDFMKWENRTHNIPNYIINDVVDKYLKSKQT